MPTYTAIALLSLLSITLSANAAQAFETQLPKSDTGSADQILSTQTQQWGDPPPNRGDRRDR